MDGPSPVFDRESSRAVDRAAIEDYGIPGIVLMENAARAVADSAIEMMRGGSGGPILIICGSGNNGGDGYAAARHLHNAGLDVTLCPLGEPRDGTDAAINRAICKKISLPENAPDALSALSRPALIIDAIFGTGLDRPVTGSAAEAIRWINEQSDTGTPVLAVDIPSGLDCDTGAELGIAVRAQRTVSFLGIKKGFLEPEAVAFTGEIVIGDIGAPIELLKDNQQVNTSTSQQVNRSALR